MMVAAMMLMMMAAAVMMMMMVLGKEMASRATRSLRSGGRTDDSEELDL